MPGDPGLYRIVATPELHTVTPGARVTYYCAQQYDTIEAADGPRDRFQWYCYNDRATAKQYGAPSIIPGAAGVLWKNAKWAFPGKHTIVCAITFKDNTKHSLEYPQWVDAVEAVLGAFFFKQRDHTIPSPEDELSIARRYLQVLRDAEKRFPITDPEKKAASDKRLEELETGYPRKAGHPVTSMT
jgi:hypothetical protein